MEENKDMIQEEPQEKAVRREKRKTQKKTLKDRLKEKNPVYGTLYEIASWVIVLAVAVGLAYFVDHVLICNAVVPTGSMETTIMPGNRLIGSRLSYLSAEPQRGDIAVFESPVEQKLLVKRIIGLPGEKVDIVDARVYIDGEILEEDYLKDEAWVVMNDDIHFEVPDGCYLMLGDNRNNSEDARYWQMYGRDPYVRRDAIQAKALFIYWPAADWKKLN